MEEKFSNVKERKFPDVPPNSPIALLQAFDGDFIEQNDLLRPAVGIELPSVRHLTPVRGMPEKYYDFKRSFSVTGRHFAPMWQDLKAKNKEGIFKTINDFGIESGLFEDIDVARVSKKISDSPLIVTVKKGERDFFLNQVGVGVSQVVPVLVETIFSKYSSSEKMLLFQQPELHLHPVAQAALGSFFFSASASGANIVIESHSNILIDRFRADLRDASLDDKKKSPTAQILFCKNGDDGNSLQIIDINRDGKLVDPPEEYFKFFIDELSRTMF